MDLTTVLREVNSWPVDDRIRLVQEVWDRIVDLDEGPGLDDALEAELDRRIAEDAAAPDDVVSWAVVKAEALARLRG